MQKKYGTDLPRSLDKLRYLLVQSFQGADGQAPEWPELTFWRFVQGDLPVHGGHAASPQLRFLIFESLAGPIKIKMEYGSPLDASVSRSWDADWMLPGKVRSDGYPLSYQLVGSLLEFIKSKVVAEHLEPLRRSLVASAPLAEGGMWESSTALRVVLPLPWDRYAPLSQKEFRLACTRGAAEKIQKVSEVELLSCGTGEHGTYNDKVHPYPAVTVTPKAWRLSRWESNRPLDQIQGDAHMLLPIRTFLDEESPSLCPSQGMEIIQ